MKLEGVVVPVSQLAHFAELVQKYAQVDGGVTCVDWVEMGTSHHLGVVDVVIVP